MTGETPQRTSGSDEERAAQEVARLGRAMRGLTLSVAAGALLYVGFGAWSGFHDLGERLAGFRWIYFLGGLLLASTNYGFRFIKWEIFLRRLGLRLPLSLSLGILLSGFTLTVTPGKLGELLKSYLLRASHGIPMARTAPVVLAERITDLVACLLLIFAGAAAFGASRNVIFVCAAGGLLVGSLVLPVLFPSLGHWLIDFVEKLPALGRMAPKLREFHEATQVVLAPVPFAVTLAISVVAWAAECAAFWLIVNGFPAAGGSGVPLLLCTFIYALTTVAGALSFLPGGLGIQESGMVGLLIATGAGVGAHVDNASATAATLLTRLATLWFAVLIGVVALLWVQRRLRVTVPGAARLPPRAQRG